MLVINGGQFGGGPVFCFGAIFFLKFFFIIFFFPPEKYDLNTYKGFL